MKINTKGILRLYTKQIKTKKHPYKGFSIKHKKIYVFIGLAIVLLFFSLTILLGSFGLMGSIGRGIAHIHIRILGYIGYIFFPLLFYPLYALYKDCTLSFRRLELLVSCCLFFIALLLLQSLLLQEGYFGNALALFFKDYIGAFGAWAIDIFFFVFAWLIFTPRNLSALFNQTKHKALVALDVIAHFTRASLYFMRSFFSRLKTSLAPHLKKLFIADSQDIFDLQGEKKEQTTKAHYDFKDVIIEEGFDEMHKSSNPQDSQPSQNQQESQDVQTSASLDEKTQAQPSLFSALDAPAAIPPKQTRVEIVESTGEEIKLQDFFKSQIAQYKDMLKSLNKHIALTEPAIKPTQPTLFENNTQEESTAPTQTPQTDTPNEPRTKTISTPPPRPLNPNVFLQSSSTQNTQQNMQMDLIKSNNIEASQSNALQMPHLQAAKTHQPNPIQVDMKDITESNHTQYSTSILADLAHTSPLHTPPFAPIIPLSSTQSLVQETKTSKNLEDAQDSKEFTPQNPPNPSKEHTPLPTSQLESHNQEKNVENEQSHTTQNLFKPPTSLFEWVDSIVQEIPAQTPQKETTEEVRKKPSFAHSNPTELNENKHLLSELEYGKIDKPANFKLPLTSFLNQPQQEQVEIDESEIDRKIENLLAKLKMFRVEGDIVRTYSGPIVTTFEFRPAPNVKVSKILALEDDLAMALRARSIRIQAPVPGKDVVGIEIPNNTTQTIYLREILESDIFKTSISPLTLALGKDIIGNPFITDLKKAPHLLIAGTTGSGKSVGLNAMILSLLYKNTPQNLKLLMIDPKKVEFSIYADIPHLIAPIISAPKKAIAALNSAVVEMERRLDLMSEAFARDIDTYNRKMVDDKGEKFPYLVIIIDELADLMMTGGKEVEFALARIAQKGRASGIHIIVATQRPSVDVITGLIKANLPSRISYKVGSKIDSKVILDSFGAEALLGRGDMLFKLSDRMIRLHAPWSAEEEIEKITEFIRNQQEVVYDKDFMLDEKDELVSNGAREGAESGDLLTEAKNIILQDKKTSASYLQRRLGIGYNKAANIIEQLEREGFLSAPNTKGVREIIG
ncbi:DNA translocase FtsK [Helicobacter sp.]|uniref:FtsK/SpoIIIE family DNA translocase n=1 Tax=Helicobacter sp. TaxID=218 RepID=UPI00342A73F8